MIIKKETRSKTVNTKITEKENKQIEALAKRYKITKSTLIRELILIGIKKETETETS